MKISLNILKEDVGTLDSLEQALLVFILLTKNQIRSLQMMESLTQTLNVNYSFRQSSLSQLLDPNRLLSSSLQNSPSCDQSRRPLVQDDGSFSSLTSSNQLDGFSVSKNPQNEEEFDSNKLKSSSNVNDYSLVCKEQSNQQTQAAQYKKMSDSECQSNSNYECLQKNEISLTFRDFQEHNNRKYKLHYAAHRFKDDKDNIQRLFASPQLSNHEKLASIFDLFHQIKNDITCKVKIHETTHSI